MEPRRRMAAFVRALLAGLPRVNCWSIAEHAGEGGPRGMQRLLSAAVWDEAGVRDDLRGYVLEHFADPGAVLDRAVALGFDAVVTGHHARFGPDGLLRRSVDLAKDQ